MQGSKVHAHNAQMHLSFPTYIHMQFFCHTFQGEQEHAKKLLI